LSNPEISQSQGAHSTSLVQAPTAGALPLRKNGHSSSLARTHPAPDPEGAVFSNILLEVDNSTLDQMDCTMQLFNERADLESQHPPAFEASPLPVLARTPFGDDDASPNFDDTVPIVSQLGSIHLQSTRFNLPSKQVLVTGDLSDATSESFHSIMLLHLNSLVSQFKSIGNATPFSNYLTSDIDFAAMRSIIDKWNFTIDGALSIDSFFQLPQSTCLYSQHNKLYRFSLSSADVSR
jgi:hypothetical protein